MTVPNLFPTLSNQPYRLAIVGEAPGADEEREGRPFVGASGKLLTNIMGRYGLLRDACYIGNVCQVRPPSNDIRAFSWEAEQIQSGLQQLSYDLAQFNPNLVLLVGGTALRAARGHYVSPVEDDEAHLDEEEEEEDEDLERESRSKKKEPILQWRGSRFMGFGGRYKCLATVHPAAIFRNYGLLPLFNFDMARAQREARSPQLVLPVRNLEVNLTPYEVLNKLDELRRTKRLLSIDIEGGIDSLSCIGFADFTSHAFIVPFNARFWEDASQEAEAWRLVAAILQDPTIPKVLQNCLYDLFVLQYSYSICVRGVVDDTMLKHWELYSELPKSLGVQASIYTDEPFWKAERHSENELDFFRYCLKDCCVTYEINDVLKTRLKPADRTHYSFNLLLLEPVLYMELRGMRYDRAKAQKRLYDLQQLAGTLQWCLDSLAYGRGELTPTEWFSIVADYCCLVRERYLVTTPDDILSHSKLGTLDAAHVCVPLLKKPTLTLADQGILAEATKRSLNVRSKTQMLPYLYETLKLPVQYAKEGGRLTDRPTSGVLALLTLYKKTEDPTIKLILKLRSIRTRCNSLDIATDDDGRIRCGYNVVGTKTGRLSCYKSPTGSGFNLQTVTKKDRDLFLPDEGCWFFQCDLSGADGWTVAAHCKERGDPTMLDDYLYGLKPARIIALLYLHGEQVLAWSRDKIKAEGKKIDGDGWLYFASKRVQHGCVTADHEVLTPSGWLPITQLKAGVPIMTWSQDGWASWEVPTKLTTYNYNGTLYTFKGSSYDLTVTHDHRMPFYTNNSLKVEQANTIACRKSADLPLSACYLGKRSEPLARLCAAIMSDGCYTERGHLTFHFKKERKIDRLILLLEKHNIHFTLSNQADGTVIITCAINPPVFPKVLDSWVLDWDDTSMAEFIDEYSYWDGHIGKTSRTVFAKKKDHLMWIATMTRLCRQGYSYQGEFTSGFGSQIHRLNLNQRAKASLESLDCVLTDVINTPVYCVTVPNSFFFVRRNDKIMITGNSNYGMKPNTMSDQILKDSYKLYGEPIYVAPATCNTLQTLYFRRYFGVKLWHNKLQTTIKTTGRLTSANGHTRIFFGRRDDYDVFKQACSEEPQQNTTYATNKAMLRLWTDPDNKTSLVDQSRSNEQCNLLRAHGSRTSLRIQPLHQVHDALNGQFRKEDTTWAVAKIKSYFNNPITIAGQSITIPFEGAYGSSWGNLHEGVI